MKDKIPLKKIYAFYIKYERLPVKTEEEMKEYHKELEQQLDIMRQLTLEDLESLTKEELEKIPVAWLYDWNKITGTFEDDSKILELYSKHCINPLTPKEYLNRYDKKRYYDDVHKILPNSELKGYIKNFLVDNKEFINDIDTCMWENSDDNKLINKTIEERLEYFDVTIGNEARTYIIKILTLKYLSKILFNNIDGFTDEFWRDRLNKVLNKTDLNKEYDKQIEKMVINKFPDKTIEEILKLPVEAILDYSIEINKDFETSKNTITEIITCKHCENKQIKEKSEDYKKPSDKEKLQRINGLVEKDKISISKLQRLFYISFPKASSIIDNLIENGIVEKLETGYKIINKESLRDILKSKLI